MTDPLDLDALKARVQANAMRVSRYPSYSVRQLADDALALIAALKEARERLDLIAAEYAIYDNARSGQPGLDLNDVARFVNAVRTLTDRTEAP